MSFNWNGLFVLRRVDEDDLSIHRIYKYSNRASDITSADNSFNQAPFPASKTRFEAVSVNPPRSWLVSLDRQPRSVLMGVYQLRSLL